MVHDRVKERIGRKNNCFVNAVGSCVCERALFSCIIITLPAVLKCGPTEKREMEREREATRLVWLVSLGPSQVKLFI